jgi:hypothetical protein
MGLSSFYVYFPDILDRGQSGIPEIIAKCVVLHDISPDSLGHRKLKKNRSCKITEDEDRPEEIVEEPSVDQLLEGRVLSVHDLSISNAYNFWPCGDLANLFFFVLGLPALRTRFHHSLSQDILWAHCVQEYLNQWSTNKEV